MLRLTREVRFAINRERDEQLAHRPANSYGGYPSLRGFGLYLTLQVSVSGQLDPATSYLLNIKQIDAVVRGAIPFVAGAMIAARSGSRPSRWLPGFSIVLRTAWPNLRLGSLRLSPAPLSGRLGVRHGVTHGPLESEVRVQRHPPPA